MLKVVDHPPAGASIKPADILAHGYDVDINLALKNADGTVTKFTVDAAAELAHAAANGTLKTWISGPLASEFRVVKAINDHLTATLDIRAFKDGSVRTDVIMGVESSYKPGMQRLLQLRYPGARPRPYLLRQDQYRALPQHHLA